MGLETEKRIDFGSILLFVIILLQFIPLPKIRTLGFAPINFTFLLLIYFLIYRIGTVFHLSGKILVLLSLLFTVVILKHLFIMLKGGQFGNIFAHIRIILYMLIFPVVCSHERKFIFFLKYFLTIAALSTFFGMLVYFFGEPFATIRSWLTQSQMTTIGLAAYGNTQISQGTQLTGLYGLPHNFSYLLATVPILCIAFYFAEHRKRWVLLFIFFLMGLFLNAERSALLSNVIAFYFFVILQKGNKISVFVILSIAAVCLFVFLYFVELPGVTPKDFDHASSYKQTGTLIQRLKKSGLSDMTNRLMWQYHGIKSVFRSPLSGVTWEQYVRTVHSLPPYVQDLERYNRTPYPHNHYINIAMHIGLFGWVILVAFLYLLIKIHIEITNRLSKHPKLSVIHKGVALALVAAMVNALFHNAGVFGYEFATCSIIALFISLLRITPRDDSYFNADI